MAPKDKDEMAEAKVTAMREKVDRAMAQVRKVLHTTRNPLMASDVHHGYSDKYFLAEFLTSAFAASAFSTLELLGMDEAIVGVVKQWSKEHRVTLACKEVETCQYLREVKSKVEIATKVTEVTDHFWEVATATEVVVYSGAAATPEATRVLRQHSFTKDVTTKSKDCGPSISERAPVEVDVTWLFNQITDESVLAFEVDRNGAQCHTPRRNPEIDAAVAFATRLTEWCQKLARRSGALGEPAGVLVPVVPVLEHIETVAARIEADDGAEAALPRVGTVALAKRADAAPETVLPLGDLGTFLEEERRGLEAKREEITQGVECVGWAKNAPDALGVAWFELLVAHLKSVAAVYTEAVDFIEAILRQQLAAAIGKVVTAGDFAEYMEFHNRKLFKAGYQPAGLCYPVRRGVNNPEGVLSIEAARKESALTDPLPTLTRCVCDGDPDQVMRFALNAAVDVEFTGKRYVHACVGHRFSTEPSPALSLIATARQFSGYVLLLGRVGGDDEFLPEHALIVRDDDDVRIPLILRETPSPKGSDEALAALSAEQQRFCAAYRGFQAEGTLFAMCVVQIKPHLEAALNLPEESLTKEIDLTRRLMDLFITHGIASDMLCYRPDTFDDPDEVPQDEKLAQVRSRADAIVAMLEECREEEHKAAQEAKKARDAGALADVIQGASKGTTPNATSAPAVQPRAATDGAPASVLSQTANALQQTNAPPAEGGGSFSLSSLPAVLEERYRRLDTDGCLRPTTIETGTTWTKKFRRTLVTNHESITLQATRQQVVRDEAFDLLDALTRSGLLPLSGVDLHVVVTATHCFDKTLVDTVIQNNVNPVEKVERSVLVVASAVHGVPVADLVTPGHAERLSELCPQLLEVGASA
eukprot:TRINITY_DN20147_c0_g1_i1.p1 TRINITY_DN20147_c0_g1~~TRINITY_DN20147_c0_g1_i1.p1  ORF type:complete len:891 (+),score=297.58 TRINITY_DN20147_c0_g1_i1:57-2675(+)